MSGLVLCWLFFSFSSTALYCRDIGDTVREIVSSRAQNETPGLQVALLRPPLVFSFGKMVPAPGEKDGAAVTDRTLFLTDHLATALVPLLFEEELERSSLSWREAFQGQAGELNLFARFQEEVQHPGGLYFVPVHRGDARDRALRGGEIFAGQEVDRVFLVSLYHGVVGHPPSGRDRIREAPFTRIASGWSDGALLLEYLARVRGRTPADLMGDAMNEIGMGSSRIVKDSDAPAAMGIGFTLATNAPDATKLLRRLSALATKDAGERSAFIPGREREGLFRGFFAFDPAVGGRSGPFHVRRHCAHLLYELESSASASLALFAADGKGFVLLSNGEDMSLLSRLREAILFDLYPDCPPPSRRDLRIVSSTDRDLIARIPNIEGFYRREDASENGPLSYFRDARVQLDAEGRLALSRPFDRVSSTFLVSSGEPGVFVATGHPSIEGWRVRFFANQPGDSGPEEGEAAGFVADEAVFRRVAWIESIQGRFVVGGIVLFLFSMLLVRFYLKKSARLI